MSTIHKRSDNIAFAPTAVKLLKLLFLPCWSLVPEQQVAGGGKRAKIIFASSRVHSHRASLVSAHRSKAIPDLFWTTFFSCFKLECPDISDMKDELPPLRPSLFSHVPPFFNYIPNGRDGRLDNEWSWLWLFQFQSSPNEQIAIDVLLRLSKQSSNTLKQI